ncbi:hypothetical protein F2P81_008662 [Scophthalmus maximus]|uniref:Uncharacterized protein n=1 Tax=Scophthalmus maximus TaxID=52904 RepID=A0A6A4T1J0_SCOMX|nr:hypothetical protein F2P81_008662 [Scophthalmus maximus]
MHSGDTLLLVAVSVRNEQHARTRQNGHLNMEQQEEMGEKASNYIRNLHIIGRSRYAHPPTKQRDPELATHDQEASFGILELAVDCLANSASDIIDFTSVLTSPDSLEDQ